MIRVRWCFRVFGGQTFCFRANQLIFSEYILNIVRITSRLHTRSIILILDVNNEMMLIIQSFGSLPICQIKVMFSALLYLKGNRNRVAGP